MSDPAAPGRGGRSFPRLKQWLRHHAASIAATVVDFGTMIALVQALGLRPVTATMAGAVAGAVANFTLGRIWAYAAEGGREGALPGQALRYALVTVASLLLNAGGEHVLVNLLHVQYVLARVGIATVVSNAWNYPMQRFFVFGRHRKAPA